MATESPHVEQLVQRGISAAREGRNGLAQQALREAVRLAPNHEQAWLWLSGVEETDQEKVRALQNVLRINPHNAAALRGLEHLSQPKKVDLASLLPPAPAPPPARAAWTPAPAQAAPPRNTVAAPAWTPPAPTAPLTTPSVSESFGPRAEYPAPAEGSPPQEQQVNEDMIANLRPAIAKARKKRRFWPSTSETVILVVLLALFVGFVTGARRWLQGQFEPPRGLTIPGQTTTAATSPPLDSPTSAPAVVPPTAAPVTTGTVFSSRSYRLQINGAAVSVDNTSVTVEVVLQNPTSRAVDFRQRDFFLRNGASGRLILSPTASSLFVDKAESDLTIPANGELSGTLVFNGDASRDPLTLIWQPFNGAVNQQITVK